MNALRNFPVFVVATLVLGLGLLGEAGLIAHSRSTARAARKNLERVSRELRTLETLRPAPTPENVALVEAELKRATQMLSIEQEELRPVGDKAAHFFAAAAPVRRPDAFFDLAGFVEAMRGRARGAGVLLRADERFGFSSYAHEAPEVARMAAVFRERRIVQYLLEALLEAKPQRLLSVQRSRPEGKPGAGATGSPAGPTARGESAEKATDYFEIDPRVSARVPGLVEATAFRLSFTGHTDTLRALVAKLADFELPVVVRAVEVAPADRPADGPAVTATTAVPLVSPGWSRFTVTVEFIVPANLPEAA